MHSKNMTIAERDEIEKAVCEHFSKELIKILPKDEKDRKKKFKKMQRKLKIIDWDRVYHKYSRYTVLVIFNNSTYKNSPQANIS